MPVLTALIVFAESAGALTVATTAPPDGLAGRVALYAAAAAGLAWFWRRMLVPMAKVLQRTVTALEVLEELPAWRDKTDRRLSRIEKRTRWNDNALTALLRELGIEDRVRRMYSTPGWSATVDEPALTWRDLEEAEADEDAVDGRKPE